MAPRTEGAGVVFDPGNASQLGHQMWRNEVQSWRKSENLLAVGLCRV